MTAVCPFKEFPSVRRRMRLRRRKPIFPTLRLVLDNCTRPVRSEDVRSVWGLLDYRTLPIRSKSKAGMGLLLRNRLNPGRGLIRLRIRKDTWNLTLAFVIGIQRLLSGYRMVDIVGLAP